MKKFSETRALLVAAAVSSASIAGTFGFAWTMRSHTIAFTRPGRLRSPLTAASKPTGTVAPSASAEGRRLFLLNCAHCHGDDARGDEGPDLYDVRKSDERIHQLIAGGVKGEMPSFRKKLNDSDIGALTAYLRTLHG
jgi:mono/diheme cytochrome c family protein